MRESAPKSERDARDEEEDEMAKQLRQRKAQEESAWWSAAEDWRTRRT